MHTNRLIAALVLLASTASQAGEGPGELSDAVAHAAASAEHTASGSAKLISAAAAVPLAAGGSAGGASAAAGHAAWTSASTPRGEGLQVDDEAYTAMPAPDEALRQSEEGAQP